jgi:signal transduction histidine kinase
MIATQPLRLAGALVLVASYVLLDWVSFLHPLYGLNITPWSPATALGLVAFVQFGWVAAVPVGVAIFLADVWVRGLPMPIPAALTLAALLACGYGTIGALLKQRLRGEAIFGDRAGLVEWVGLVAAGTAVNSMVFAGGLAIAGLVPGGEWPVVALRFWIGDATGIIVAMPLVWMLATASGRLLLREALTRWESLAHFAAAAAALWVAFGVGAGDEFKYFYALLLPVVWAAARHGLPGAVLIAALVQAGVILGVELKDLADISVFEVQTLSVAIALVGFFVGVVTDEQRRLGSDLRQSLRLAAAGETAGALAHELNQPLTALAAYGEACEALIARGESGERLREAIRRMVAESSRAARVVQRLRDFFLSGSTRLEPVAIAELVRTAAAPFAVRAPEAGVRLELEPLPEAVVLGDRLQLEVLVRNLLANAFDSVAALPPERREVRVCAEAAAAGSVALRVEDSGRGVAPAVAARLFEPFRSTKSSGLGLGLAISRAIAQAHGGELAALAGEHGAFRLVLPLEERSRGGA